MDRSKNLEKEYFITVQKISPTSEGFDNKNTFFEMARNLIRKSCFQMTLNARQLVADSL